MIHPPHSSPAKVKKVRPQKPPPAPGPELHPVVHKMLNQLTIMNLSCFKFRAAAESCCSLSLLVEVERIEHAVTEMTSLLESVSQAAISKAIARVLGVVEGSDRRAAQTQSNVYPLFEPKKRCR
jgi:hypothetical protein